jgi:hypothetical protein
MEISVLFHEKNIKKLGNRLAENDRKYIAQ